MLVHTLPTQNGWVLIAPRGGRNAARIVACPVRMRCPHRPQRGAQQVTDHARTLPLLASSSPQRGCNSRLRVTSEACVAAVLIAPGGGRNAPAAVAISCAPAQPHRPQRGRNVWSG